MPTVTIEAGALLRKHIRVYLKTARLNDLIDAYSEDKSLLSSVFYVTAKAPSLIAVGKDLDHWKRENGL